MKFYFAPLEGVTGFTYRNAHQTAKTINKLILKKNKCDICGSTKSLDIHNKEISRYFFSFHITDN